MEQKGEAETKQQYGKINKLEQFWHNQDFGLSITE